MSEAKVLLLNEVKRCEELFLLVASTWHNNKVYAFKLAYSQCVQLQNDKESFPASVHVLKKFFEAN